MNEVFAREEICRVGRSLFDRGYVNGTAGNISVRLDDGFLITPTDACLGFLDPARIARVDAQGQPVGSLRPSKTLALHRAIYKSAARFDSATRCVIHTHSSHCVALSLTSVHNELLPPITPYFVMKVGRVPLIEYSRPGSQEAVDAVVAAITRYGEQGRPLRAVMLQRLGPNVWHDTPGAAMAVLEELEETARLVVLSPGVPTALDEMQIEALRHAFNARW